MVSCGLDGLLIFWDFRTYCIVSKVAHESPLTQMLGFRDGGFVAVVAQDRVVRVYDVTTGKLTRRFSGHSREITDMAFTPDGRRLLVASLDSTVRVWDMPTGRCLSWLHFDAPVLSMTVSHSGEYLCVAQTGKEGIYMYVDRSLYETVHFWKEPTAPVPVADSLVLVDQNNMEADANQNQVTETDVESDADDDDGEVGPNDDDSLVVVSRSQKEIGAAREAEEQRGDCAVTLAAVPRAYWTALFHLEAIKTRNRAKAAPAAPVQAPFFLPTIVKGGVAPSFPTPAEYQQLLQHEGDTKKTVPGGESKSVAAVSLTAVGEEGGGVLSSSDGAMVTGAAEIEEDIVAQLASMNSAWEDDGWGGDEEEEVDNASAGAPKGGGDVYVPRIEIEKNGSRIIKRKTSLPR